METASGEQLLTVKDIAKYAAFDKSEEGINRAMRQIRHWTQCDLLRPYTPKKTGTGIPRLYPDEPTIEIAAILLEVARYGATVDILKPVAEALYDAMEGAYGPTIMMAQTGEADACLQIWWKEDPKTGKLYEAEVNFFTKNDPAGDDGELASEPSSSILINLSSIVDRIYPLPWHKRVPAKG